MRGQVCPLAITLKAAARTLIGRGSPQQAANTGNSAMVGRPAEYNTFGEYAGGVFLCLRRSTDPAGGSVQLNTGDAYAYCAIYRDHQPDWIDRVCERCGAKFAKRPLLHGWR